MPTLSTLEEGETPEAGIFSMSPLCSIRPDWAFGSRAHSSVVPALDSRCESDCEPDDEDGDEWTECGSGDGKEFLLPCYPLEMRARMAHQETTIVVKDFPA